MPFMKDSKCKHNCKHCHYVPEKGWVCEEYGECFMCSLCDCYEKKKEDLYKEVLL